MVQQDESQEGTAGTLCPRSLVHTMKIRLKTFWTVYFHNNNIKNYSRASYLKSVQKLQRDVHNLLVCIREDKVVVGVHVAGDNEQLLAGGTGRGPGLRYRRRYTELHGQ